MNNIRILIFFILMFFTMMSAARSEDVVANIPLIFSIEGQDVDTQICMEVIKNDIPADKGKWKNFIKNSQSLDLSFFVGLITSIQRKDLISFNTVVHPTLASDKIKVKKQAEAYFRQFSVLEVLGVKGLFKFSSYQVIFLELKYKDTIYIVDFMFAMDSTGKYKFLPYKSKSLTASTFSSWAHSKLGYINDNVKYCDKSSERNDVITLENTNFYFKEISTKNKMKLIQFVSEQNKLLKLRDITSYLQTLSAASKSRISKWLETADDKGKELFMNANVNSTDFFIIDSKPLYIAFNQNTEYGRHVVFYIEDLKGSFRQINLSYGSVSSRFLSSKLFMNEVSALADVKNKP